MTDKFFSLTFLLAIYFMTTLGLIQGLIPGGITYKEKDGNTQQIIHSGRIGISLIIASAFSGVVFYFSIYQTTGICKDFIVHVLRDIKYFAHFSNKNNCFILIPTNPWII
jgi:hypothetical protein